MGKCSQPSNAGLKGWMITQRELVRRVLAMKALMFLKRSQLRQQIPLDVCA